MKKLQILIPTIFIIILSALSFKSREDVVNYLNTSDTLVFNSVTYKLAWSSHPADNYYKQEYLPADEKLKKYKSMLLVDFVVTPDSTMTLLAQKVAELRERKKTDNITNFRIMQNDAKREYMLDFIVSDADGGPAYTVEWNAYHYKAYTDKQGHRGILLFGLSKRAYGNDITPFLKGLKENRDADLKLFIPYGIPDIEVK